MLEEEPLFTAALDLPASERAAFLDRACAGNPALRQRLDHLIASHAAVVSGHFLEDTTFQPGSLLPADEAPGTALGDRYTLVRKLGEGGCGAVYLAEQTSPIRRPVALKIIKLGMDTREVIARFEAERQTLALMDHPAIARVFDAGATATGRPYFVMEFVDGIPITKFCDEHQLDLPARLALFARVCGAIQHAHQKGIIHRDLKPSNILVTLRDGAPAPRVIDFGIAKATSGRLTEHTLVTVRDHFIGTPAYMSPEQADASFTDIDTRSDIYSLGVLLYELLAGRPPHDPQSLAQAGLAEIRRLIREVDPPRPSAQISALSIADRATVARLRNFAAPQLVAALKGDLDWIVMRCLEKDRARRYTTASALADDLHRYLADEPIDARPPSALYRTQKFIARNRLATAAAAAVTIALLLGTAVSLRQAHRATAAEHLARAAQTDAQRRQAQSEELVAYMLDTFRTEARKVGRLELLDAVGEKALDYFSSLDPRDLTDVALTQQVKALTQMGSTRIDQARYADADNAFAVAYSRAITLTTRHPEHPEMVIDRAQVEFWIGFIARLRGDSAKTRLWFERYRDSGLAYANLTGHTVRAKTQLAYGQHSMALLELDQGNLSAARAALFAERAVKRELLATEPQSPKYRGSLASTENLLGQLAEAEGRLADAFTCYHAASVEVADLLKLEPHVPIWSYLTAEFNASEARLLALQGRLNEALALNTAGQATFIPVAAKDPDNYSWKASLLDYRLDQIEFLLAITDPAEAWGKVEPLLTDALTRLQALTATAPTSQEYARRLVKGWILNTRLRSAHSPTDARTAIHEAVTRCESWVKQGPPDILSLQLFAQSHLLAAQLGADVPQAATARQHWQRVVDVLGPRAARTPTHWRLLDPLAQASLLLGDSAAASLYLERLRTIGYHPLEP